MNRAIPASPPQSCPQCSSLLVIREFRPCIGLESAGDTTYMLNGTHLRCHTCGHTWDRRATRGLGLKNYPYVKPKAAPAERPGLLTRIFRRLFPITEEIPVKYLPLTPPVLALALELQRRAIEKPEVRLLDAVQAILDERPPLDVQGCVKLAAQINDLQKIAEPGPQDMRVALMLFMPDLRGCLFTLRDLPLFETLLFPDRSPFAPVAATLAAALDGSWPEVVELVRHLPVSLPSQVLDPQGRPAESRHPAAAGPQPENVRDFMRPDQG